MDSENCLIIDKAFYVGFSAVLKSLDANVFDRVISIATIDRLKKGKFFKTNGVFMGMLHSELLYPHNNSVRLTIEEMSLSGKTGLKYSLFLYNKSAEKWQKRKQSKTGKYLILFQNVLYQLKNDEFEFHFTSTKKLDISIWVKHFMESSAELRTETYQYISLMHAAGTLAQRCNIYGVVHRIMKMPCETSRKNFHGMCLLTDPSCYDGLTKENDYLCHIFASTLELYPAIHTGDIVRIHRARLEPRDNKRPDIRVFHEYDVVVFPLDDSQPPRSAAIHFQLTEEDMVQLEKLKIWSTERYGHAVGIKPTESTEPQLITLSEITCEKAFNLSCRLVEFFEEDNGIALWVEDGTRCSLFTCSDQTLQPYDSQLTQDVCNNCLRICVRCSKTLIRNVAPLQHNMLLYLRHVETSVQFSSLLVGNVAQFEVKGGVELLPINTRYHKTLVQRLKKENCHPLQPELREHLNHTAQHPVEPVVLTEIKEPTTFPVALRPAASSDMEISEFQSSPEAMEAFSSVPLHPFRTSKGDRLSSGEYSTEKAMVEMPSDIFCSFDLEMTSWSSARSDGNPQHVHAHPKPGMLPSSELHDISFGQVITSTQKVTPLVGDLAPDTADGMQETSVPSGRGSDSPNPSYRAVEEVLDVRTRNTGSETKLVQETIAPFASAIGRSWIKGDVRTRTSPIVETLTSTTSINCIRTGENTTYVVGKTSDRKRNASQSSIVNVHPDGSQESDDDSIIVFNPLSQPDFEQFFAAVETTESQVVNPAPLQSLSDVDSIRPEDRFRIKAHLTNILPRLPCGEVTSLDSMLIAFCSECKRIWQYDHFKDSISRRVRRKKKTRPSGLVAGDASQVINFLCCEQEHSRNCQQADPDCLEYDEACCIDYSYAFVCPLCKHSGIPDSLCQLVPSFFFWLHITYEGTCLHVMASGVHAEYFLGTKADHVCRSEEIRKRADDRRRKLLEFDQPLTFSLRKASAAKEFYLENTFVVYNSKHLLPW